MCALQFMPVLVRWRQKCLSLSALKLETIIWSAEPLSKVPLAAMIYFECSLLPFCLRVLAICSDFTPLPIKVVLKEALSRMASASHVQTLQISTAKGVTIASSASNANRATSGLIGNASPVPIGSAVSVSSAQLEDVRYALRASSSAMASARSAALFNIVKTSNATNQAASSAKRATTWTKASVKPVVASLQAAQSVSQRTNVCLASVTISTSTEASANVVKKGAISIPTPSQAHVFAKMATT